MSDPAIETVERLSRAYLAECNEVERLRAEHRAFVDGLTAKLNEHGVPPMRWPDAIDWLAAYGGSGTGAAAPGDDRGGASGEQA